MERVLEKMKECLDELRAELARREGTLREALRAVIGAVPGGLPVRRSKTVYSRTVRHGVGVPTHTTHYYLLDYDPFYGLTVRYNHSWSGRGPWIVTPDEVRDADALKALVGALPEFIAEVVEEARGKAAECDEVVRQLKERVAQL